MKKFRGKTLGIDQGEEQLFSDYDTGGDMWVSSCPRERRKRVKFSETYLSTPAVLVSLSLWDVSNGANLRADLTADSVDETGFDLVFKTWQDTQVARVRMSWIAFGEVEDEDNWDV